MRAIDTTKCQLSVDLIVKVEGEDGLLASIYQIFHWSTKRPAATLHHSSGKVSTPPHPMTWVAEDGVAHLVVLATGHGTVNSITSLPASYVAGKFMPWLTSCSANTRTELA